MGRAHVHHCPHVLVVGLEVGLVVLGEGASTDVVDGVGSVGGEREGARVFEVRADAGAHVVRVRGGTELVAREAEEAHRWGRGEGEKGWVIKLWRRQRENQVRALSIATTMEHYVDVADADVAPEVVTPAASVNANVVTAGEAAMPAMPYTKSTEELSVDIADKACAASKCDGSLTAPTGLPPPTPADSFTRRVILRPPLVIFFRAQAGVPGGPRGCWSPSGTRSTRLPARRPTLRHTARRAS